MPFCVNRMAAGYVSLPPWRAVVLFLAGARFAKALDMSSALNSTDVAVRAEGDQWVVVDHAFRRVHDERFGDPMDAIELGLFMARDQGGAVWLLPATPRVRTNRHVSH